MSSKRPRVEGCVRLSDALTALNRGRKYLSESEITKELLLAYLKQTGEIVTVTPIPVAVHEMGGLTVNVNVDAEHNRVSYLKREVQHRQGTCRTAVTLVDEASSSS